MPSPTCPQLKGLRPYGAQGIVSLFETLARMHARLVDGLQGMEAGTDTGEDGFDEDLMSNITIVSRLKQMGESKEQKSYHQNRIISIYIFIYYISIIIYLAPFAP